MVEHCVNGGLLCYLQNILVAVIVLLVEFLCKLLMDQDGVVAYNFFIK